VLRGGCGPWIGSQPDDLDRRSDKSCSPVPVIWLRDEAVAPIAIRHVARRASIVRLFRLAVPHNLGISNARSLGWSVKSLKLSGIRLDNLIRQAKFVDCAGALHRQVIGLRSMPCDGVAQKRHGSQRAKSLQ
jgi:hypothetical protein